MLAVVTFISFVVTAITGIQQEPGSAAAAPEKLALTVEYVGAPDSARGRAFVAFLRKNFRAVDVTSAKAIDSPVTARRAFENADVLLVDASLAGRLPAGYDKPMVVLSGQGVRTAQSLGAKLDWL